MNVLLPEPDLPITSQREPPIVTLPMFASALPFGSASLSDDVDSFAPST